MSDKEFTLKNDFPFSLLYAMKIPATARTQTIRRTEYESCTVEYVVSGAGFLEINGESYSLRENDVYFLMPGSTHAYWPDQAEPWVKLFFTVEGVLMQELLKAYGMENVYRIEDCPELKKYFDRMRALRYSPDISNPQASVVFHQFLQEASTLISGVRTHIPKDVEALKLALDNALEENFRLSGFAAGRKVSEAHLIRQFSLHFGMTPYEYLMSRKMETAQHLLLYSSLSVKEIAARLAFSDQYYFSNYFKRRTGLSPRFYRVAVRQQQKKIQG